MIQHDEVLTYLRETRYRHVKPAVSEAEISRLRTQYVAAVLSADKDIRQAFKRMQAPPDITDHDDWILLSLYEESVLHAYLSMRSAADDEMDQLGGLLMYLVGKSDVLPEGIPDWAPAAIWEEATRRLTALAPILPYLPNPKDDFSAWLMRISGAIGNRATMLTRSCVMQHEEGINTIFDGPSILKLLQIVARYPKRIPKSAYPTLVQMLQTTSGPAKKDANPDVTARVCAAFEGLSGPTITEALAAWSDMGPEKAMQAPDIVVNLKRMGIEDVDAYLQSDECAFKVLADEGVMDYDRDTGALTMDARLLLAIFSKVNVLYEVVHAIKEERDEAVAALDVVMRELEELRGKLARAQENAKRYKGKCTALKDRLQERLQELEQLKAESEVKKLRKENSHLAATIAKLEARLAAIEADAKFRQKWRDHAMPVDLGGVIDPEDVVPIPDIPQKLDPGNPMASLKGKRLVVLGGPFKRERDVQDFWPEAESVRYFKKDEVNKFADALPRADLVIVFPMGNTHKMYQIAKANYDKVVVGQLTDLTRRKQ